MSDFPLAVATAVACAMAEVSPLAEACAIALAAAVESPFAMASEMALASDCELSLSTLPLHPERSSKATASGASESFARLAVLAAARFESIVSRAKAIGERLPGEIGRAHV